VTEKETPRPLTLGFMGRTHPQGTFCGSVVRGTNRLSGHVVRRDGCRRSHQLRRDITLRCHGIDSTPIQRASQASHQNLSGGRSAAGKRLSEAGSNLAGRFSLTGIRQWRHAGTLTWQRPSQERAIK
jgi:hypothetical protein